MFNNLPGASVSDVNENDLIAGFGSEEEAADDTKKNGGKEKTSDDSKKSTGKSDKSNKGKSATASATTKSKTSVSDMPSGDLGDAFSSDDDEEENDEEDQDDEDTKKKNDKKKAAGTKKKEEDVSDDDDEDADDDDEETDEDQDDEDADDDDEDNDDETPVEIKDFLKARVNLLLKKGEWKQFEIDGKKPGDIEWDEDTFAEIELQQRSWQRQELKDDLLDSFGPYGRDIAEYASNGGDPDKLIEIFQEQQRIQTSDITNEDGQKAMVLEYQTKVLGKSVESANRFIKNLIADKELEAEAKETKTLLDKDLEEQAEALKTEAEETKKANEKAIKDSQLLFAKNVNELVNKATDIPADEKQQLIKVLTKFDKQLKNGAKVNEFYFKFAEFKKDLPNYIKLVRLVMNPEKFMKSLKNEGKTETAEKVFRMGRTANSKKKVKTNASSSEEGGSKKSGFRLL